MTASDATSQFYAKIEENEHSGSNNNYGKLKYIVILMNTVASEIF